MKVKEAMSSAPQIISEATTLKEAATQMQKNDFGFLPIGAPDKIDGVITDRDIVIKGLANGKDISSIVVKEIMSRDVITCSEEDDIQVASDRMGDKQIRRLLVLNKDNKACGVISLGDISRKTKDAALCGRVIQAISED